MHKQTDLNSAKRRPGRRNEEQEKRAAALRSTKGSLHLSGLGITPGARCLFDRYIAGELSLAELGAEMKTLHEPPPGDLPSREPA